MKINILCSLLLLSCVVFVTSQDDKADDKGINEIKKFIMDLIEAAKMDEDAKKALEKLLPLKDDNKKAAMELVERLKESAKKDLEKSKPPTPEGEPEKKPEGEPEKKPEGGPEKKPEGGPEKKPEGEPEKKPEDKPEKKPEDKPDTKPGDKPTGEKDVVKTFVMIVKDIKSTTKKTFTSIKDLIKNGLKGRPRQPFIKQLIDRLSDEDVPPGGSVHVVLDPSKGLSVFSNPEEIADLRKKLKKKDSEKKKDEDDKDDADDDDDDDGLDEILSYFDLDK